MAKRKEFELGVIQPGSKGINFWGPGEFFATIDYDVHVDRDRLPIRRTAKKMIRILNKYWNVEEK